MKFLRLLNTVKYLKFEQLFYRIYYFILKPKSNKLVFKIQLREQLSVWNNTVKKPISMIASNEFIFLNHKGIINIASDWNSLKQEKLWLYNLHYFDDLNAENNKARVDWHNDLINKWINENPYAVGNAWEPYPNSLRIVNWIKWSLQGNELTEHQLNNLALQAEHLSKTVEWHILANHLFANAKALIFAGIFFDTEDSSKWLKLGLKIYKREIDEQVLADGANFELTPMYHAIFLEDLLDIYQLLMICYRADHTIDKKHLVNKIIAMLNWLHYLSHPDGEIAFFNDAAFGIAAPYGKLKKYADSLGISVEEIGTSDISLINSGYVIVKREAYNFILDVAEVGPSYQPGHAHADTLSFELSINGARFLVNSGISQYGLGAERLYQRGTSAHNTIEIDKKNSSEIWSGFRVANRVSPKLNNIRYEGKNITDFSASYTGLTGLIHSRSLIFKDREITLKDELTGAFKSAISYLHFHPDVKITKDNNHFICELNGNIVDIYIQGDVETKLVSGFWYPEFGKEISNIHLEINFLSNNSDISIVYSEVGL